MITYQLTKFDFETCEAIEVCSYFENMQFNENNRPIPAISVIF